MRPLVAATFALAYAVSLSPALAGTDFESQQLACSAKCGIVPQRGGLVRLSPTVHPKVRACFDKCMFTKAPPAH